METACCIHPSSCRFAFCVIIILWVRRWLNHASSTSSGSCVSTVDDTDTLKSDCNRLPSWNSNTPKARSHFCWMWNKAFFLPLNCWTKHKVAVEIRASVRNCYAQSWVYLWVFNIGFSPGLPRCTASNTYIQWKSAIKPFIKIESVQRLNVAVYFWFEWNALCNRSADNKFKALVLCSLTLFSELSSSDVNCFTITDKLRVQHTHSLIVCVYVCSLKWNWSAVNLSVWFTVRTFMKWCIGALIWLTS